MRIDQRTRGGRRDLWAVSAEFRGAAARAPRGTKRQLCFEARLESGSLARYLKGQHVSTINRRRVEQIGIGLGLRPEQVFKSRESNGMPAPPVACASGRRG